MPDYKIELNLSTPTDPQYRGTLTVSSGTRGLTLEHSFGPATNKRYITLRNLEVVDAFIAALQRAREHIVNSTKADGG